MSARWLAPWLLLALATAQDRKTAAGLVRGPDDKPLAGAEVTFVWSPDGGDAAGAGDQVGVVTDERGRFKADLRPHGTYLVWAMGKPEPDGSRLVGEVGFAAAGWSLQLRATRVGKPGVCKVDGLSAWPELAPFSLRCRAVGQHLGGVVVPILDPDAIPLPPLPDEQELELLDKDGALLSIFAYRAERAGRQYALAPPQPLPMLVVDGQGQPMANVEIAQRMTGRRNDGRPGTLSPPDPPRWRVLGTTAADGRLVARIPLAHDPLRADDWLDLLFVARHPGCQASVSGFREHPFCDRKEVARAGLQELRFQLRPAQPRRGRLTAGTTPLASVPVHAIGALEVQGLERDWTLETWTATAVTLGNGEFAFEDLPVGVRDLRVVPGVGIQLPGQDAKDRLPPQPFGLRPFDNGDGELSIDLLATRRVDLRILGPDHGPARTAEVAWMTRRGADGWHLDWPLRCVPDGAGRVSVRLQPGPWQLFVCDGTAVTHAFVDVDRDQELALQLEPLPTMRGRVLDADGNPVARARLSGMGMRWHHSRDPQEQARCSLANTLNWRFLSAVTTDADGAFVCHFLDHANIRFRGQFRAGDRQSEQVEIRANDEPIDIVIR